MEELEGYVRCWRAAKYCWGNSSMKDHISKEEIVLGHSFPAIFLFYSHRQILNQSEGNNKTGSGVDQVRHADTNSSSMRDERVFQTSSKLKGNKSSCGSTIPRCTVIIKGERISALPAYLFSQAQAKLSI
jgi:hypothetical protein